MTANARMLPLMDEMPARPDPQAFSVHAGAKEQHVLSSKIVAKQCFPQWLVGVCDWCVAEVCTLLILWTNPGNSPCIAGGSQCILLVFPWIFFIL